MRRVPVAAILLVLALHTGPALAASRSRIRALNIGAQAVLTLASGAVQGKVRSARDVLRCLLSGSASGYGFYEAKSMMGDGDVRTGWIVANLSGSLSENAAAGKHPLAQVGYSVGPVRLRVPIPRLDPDAASWVWVDVSAYEAAAMVRGWNENDRVSIRGGLIAFDRDTVYPDDSDDFVVVGSTYGMYPGVWTGAGVETWRHELVHAVQSLQAGSVEPSLPLLTWKPRKNEERKKSIVRFQHLKAGAVNLANDLAITRQRYEDRWTEIEANRIAEDEEP